MDGSQQSTYIIIIIIIIINGQIVTPHILGAENIQIIHNEDFENCFEHS